MAKRTGLLAALARSQKEAQRKQRQRELVLERAQRAASAGQREQMRAASAAQRDRERAERLGERARKEQEVANGLAEVRDLNEDLASQYDALERLLHATLRVDDYFDLDQLKPEFVAPQLELGVDGAVIPVPDESDFMPTAPGGLVQFLPGRRKRHEEDVEQAKIMHAAAVQAREQLERERQRRVDNLTAHHVEILAAAEKAHSDAVAEVEAFKASLASGDPTSVVEYFDLVLKASTYPDTFPQNFRLAFVPESKQLVVEYELPGLDCIPKTKEYRYVKAKNEITSSERNVSQTRSLYASVVAQLTLRTVHEIFEADRTGLIESVVFNGIVRTVHPGSGQPIQPCLITLRATRSTFLQLDLSKVDASACLKHLSASVSRNPAELEPVRPVLEFSMVDRRFVSEEDILSGLDQRPNLMELSPKEFESLITNLFTKMGLESRQTQPSRDGGVDCVAFDPRPIFGGKVVIQAKRYRGTVGVSAVRDLYGTLQNEGASKGILVTTSGYGQASYEFAAGKPMELLDGGNLLYLLLEHAGVEARIQVPEDWSDPTFSNP